MYPEPVPGCCQLTFSALSCGCSWVPVAPAPKDAQQHPGNAGARSASRGWGHGVGSLVRQRDGIGAGGGKEGVIRFGKAPESWSDCGDLAVTKNESCVCLFSTGSKAPVLSVCHRAGGAVINSSAYLEGLWLCAR